jgi:putative serine protease PepD
MDARRALARRRTRRRRAGVVLLGSAAIVSGMVWVSRAGPADITVTDTPVRLGTTADVETTTTDASADESPELLFSFAPPASSEVAEDVIVVRTHDGETLAGALLVRDGYVVTSGTALAGADEVEISWGDSSLPGTVIGRDPITDVTVIRVDGATPGLGKEDALAREGEEVNMPTEDGSRSTQRVVAEQSTSAMVNGDPVVGVVELDGRLGDVPPGSPAYDRNGDVVGITTATADAAPAALVPISLAREVADEIIDDGEADHPWLGVKARNPADGESDRAGSLVTAVNEDGPAAAAGMLAGDLITRIGDTPVASMAAMVATLRSHEPGDVVQIIVWRAGTEVGCTVELTSHLDVDA